MAWTAPNASVAMVYEECCNCGMLFAMTERFQGECRERKNGRGRFYCPAGHRQHYTGETEEQKLRHRLASAERARDWQSSRANTIDRSRRAVKGQLTKLKNRIHKGMCPHCNRHFENLQRHMETKHAEKESA